MTKYLDRIKILLGLDLTRINRSSYIYSLIASVIVLILLIAISSIFTSSVNNSISIGYATILTVLYYAYGFSLGVRRLHDLDYSGWGILLALIPIANILLAVELLFFRGSDENNRYGAPLDRSYAMGFALTKARE